MKVKNKFFRRRLQPFFKQIGRSATWGKSPGLTHFYGSDILETVHQIVSADTDTDQCGGGVFGEFQQIRVAVQEKRQQGLFPAAFRNLRHAGCRNRSGFEEIICLVPAVVYKDCHIAAMHNVVKFPGGPGCEKYYVFQIFSCVKADQTCIGPALFLSGQYTKRLLVENRSDLFYRFSVCFHPFSPGSLGSVQVRDILGVNRFGGVNMRRPAAAAMPFIMFEKTY